VQNRNYNKNNDKRNIAAANAAAARVDRAVYDALKSVFSDGAFCARALTDALKSLDNERSHAFVTSAFYGVLDNNVRFEKLISGLCEKAPDKNSSVVLKIGLFYLHYADMPPYAAVNRVVELAKTAGAYSGFINAVLKRSVGFKPKFDNSLDEFSYAHNAPQWLCKLLIADYGERRAAEILDAKLPEKTHIRPVKGRISDDEFISIARGLELTDCGCYCDKAALSRFDTGTYAVLSLSSARAVKTYINGVSSGKALDLCAAPGGKSIYLSELGDFKITSCDIYPHKIELMRGYAKKLGAKLNIVLNDATQKNDAFLNAFDLVVADCPCSGTGTLKTKPDVMIKRKPADLNDLCALQDKILDTSASYCRLNGVLCYSTCSILKCENEDTVKRFLSRRDDYELMDETKFLPDTDKCDGFYIARMKRVKQ